LTALDVSENTALSTLLCNNNQLSSLEVSHDGRLRKLSCFENRLTSLDVSGNIALTDLDCAGNQITYLNVSNNTVLTSLFCEKNELTDLDVSGSTVLKTLYCEDNLLNHLDVSKNTALEYLYCNNNRLTGLDLSRNTSLTGLNCNVNQLENLNVINNPNMLSLACGSNALTTLDISNNVKLLSRNIQIWGRHMPDYGRTYVTDLPVLDLSNMQTLAKVCIWESSFVNDYDEINIAGSPNVYFTTECAVPILNEEVKIYMDPANNMLVVETGNLTNPTMEICNINGSKIYMKTLYSNPEQTDMSGFKPGVYLVKVKLEGVIYDITLIVVQ